MRPPTLRFREKLGLWVGTGLSPLFGIASTLRDASVFHPRGICSTAQVTPARTLAPPLAGLAQRLAGPALVRLSAGLWRQEHMRLPDLLGCAIRFQASPHPEMVSETTQDLLLATARSPWSLALDALRTNQRDFLDNNYFAIAPFRVEGWRQCKLRIRPKPVPESAANAPIQDRYGRVRAAVARTEAAYLLEILCPQLLDQWQPLNEIRLQQEVAIDRAQLRFNPFQTGQGLKPEGFIHYLRPLPYRVSQFCRTRLRPATHAPLELVPAERSRSRRDAPPLQAPGQRRRATAARRAGPTASPGPSERLH